MPLANAIKTLLPHTAGNTTQRQTGKKCLGAASMPQVWEGGGGHQVKLSRPVCAGNRLWPAIGPWCIAVTCLALSNSACVWDFIITETGLVHRPKSLAYRLCNRNKSYFSFYIHLWNLIGVKNTQEFPCSAGFPTEIPRLAILGKQLATQCVLWYSRLKCNFTGVAQVVVRWSAAEKDFFILFSFNIWGLCWFQWL